MQFRHARHTDNLEIITDFYQNVIGLKKLGGFTGHDGYDGVFLGRHGQDWHLEFTQSDKPAHHQPDKDDLLVFYLESQAQIQAIIDRAMAAGIHPVTSENPYWNEHGIELTDPDGFGVILTLNKFS